MDNFVLLLDVLLTEDRHHEDDADGLRGHGRELRPDDAHAGVEDVDGPVAAAGLGPRGTRHGAVGIINPEKTINTQ